MGFYITPIELILQLEVNLNEGKCPLDTPDVAATLFRLNEVDTSTGTLEYGFALGDLLEVRALLELRRVPCPGPGPGRAAAAAAAAAPRLARPASSSSRLAAPPQPTSNSACVRCLPLPQGYTGGMFDLYFCNCEPNSVVDMDARIALFNQKGARVDYLPVGEDALAGIYFVRRGGGAREADARSRPASRRPPAHPVLPCPSPDLALHLSSCPLALRAAGVPGVLWPWSRVGTLCAARPRSLAEHPLPNGPPGGP
jgi:hypothetical protein